MALILVGCEFSGVVAAAFRAQGHEAYSCDLLDGEIPDWHIKDDVLEVLTQYPWALAILHPPCTYLCSSGLHWNKRRPGRERETEKSLEFVRTLLSAPVPRIALENPIGCISSKIRKPDQIVQPWQFGHPESKSTCLWLKDLPLLKPTDVLVKPASGRWANQTPTGQNNLGPSEDRWAERSRTYQGIADAMAAQWSPLLDGSA